MNKKTCVLFTIIASTALITGLIANYFKFQKNSMNPVFGDDNPYVLNLNRAITSGELSSGEAVFDTINGNPISFKFSSASSGDVLTLATDGYFYNDTAITGIKKIEATLSGGSATLSYGNAKDVLNVGSQVLDTESGSEVPFTVNLAEPSDYFRLSNVIGPMEINSLRITYMCSNDYQYAVTREANSKDLLYTAAITDNKVDGDHSSINNRCFDTVDSSSGYSYKISADSEGGGWPSVQLGLTKNYDLSHSGLTIKAKFTAEGVAAVKWISFFLYRGGPEWEQATNERGIDFSGYDGEWLSATVTSSQLASQLKEGFNLTEIGLIRIVFNFEDRKGHEQNIYLDELHFVEEPTLQESIEMVEMDTGMCSGTTSSITYSDVYGSNSTSARKFTFENSDLTAAWGRPRVTFSPDHSGLSNIDLCNTTMRFDIKLSSEFFDNDNGEKHTFVLKMYSGWNSSEQNLNVYNFFPNGAAGFYPENTDNGWIHLEQNMNISIYQGFHSLIRMEFQFFGLNSTTKTTAWVVIDNITFTPNA